MSFGTPSVPTPAAPVIPQAPPPPTVLGQQTTPGKKPGAKPSQPTFLGAGLTPSPSQASQKSLIGQ